MHRFVRFLLVLPLALASMASTCDEEDEILGTYSVRFFEIQDTCDDEQDSYDLRLEITQQGDEFRVQIVGSGLLTGGIRDDGILAVAGLITEADGTRPRSVQLELDIRNGRIQEGAGRITWNGTFPGVPGSCIQRLDVTGSRLAVVPVIG